MKQVDLQLRQLRRLREEYEEADPGGWVRTFGREIVVLGDVVQALGFDDAGLAAVLGAEATAAYLRLALGRVAA